MHSPSSCVWALLHETAQKKQSADRQSVSQSAQSPRYCASSIASRFKSDGGVCATVDSCPFFGPTGSPPRRMPRCAAPGRVEYPLLYRGLAVNSFEAIRRNRYPTECTGTNTRCCPRRAGDWIVFEELSASPGTGQPEMLPVFSIEENGQKARYRGERPTCHGTMLFGGRHVRSFHF